jgi:hypothetical protein
VEVGQAIQWPKEAVSGGRAGNTVA